MLALSSVQSTADEITDDETKAAQLRHAAAKGDLYNVKRIYEELQSANLVDEFGRTALMEATLNNHPDVAGFLIKQGADPNLKDQYGDNVLHIAARNGRLSVTRALLKSLIDKNKKDKNGNTPLMYASTPLSRERSFASPIFTSA